jgi:hypothetical protein
MYLGELNIAARSSYAHREFASLQRFIKRRANSRSAQDRRTLA